jgi:hypothetical protein
MAVFDTAYFFAAYHLAEYTAFDRQTLGLITTATCYGCGIFIDTRLNHQRVVCQDGL